MGSEWVVDKVNDNSAILRNPSIHHDKRCVAFKQLKLIESVSPQKEAELKQCSECREVKPLDDFPNHRQGLKKKMCKVCNVQKIAEGREKAKNRSEEKQVNTSKKIDEGRVTAVKSFNPTKPSYYVGSSGLTVFRVIKEFGASLLGAQAFYFGNVVKYILRFPNKNGKEDLLKAREYLDKLLEEYDG